MIDRNLYIGRAQDLNLYGVTIDHADGHSFTDIEGKEYLDFMSAASSLPLGYGRKDLVNAYVQQCEKVPHTCTVYTFSEIVHQYAKQLTETSKIPGAKLLFGAFGSDSIDASLKCAQAYTGRQRILAFQKSYHGGTFLSLAASGFDGLKKHLALPQCFTHLPYPAKPVFEDVLNQIKQELEKGDVACLLMETILGDGGIIEADPKFFPRVLELLHSHGAILILDEIQTGIGRTGTFWGYEQFDFKPDLFCAAKALGGGYVPLSACIGKSEIIDSLENAQNAFTLSGHAVSCAVGLELLNAFEQESILENVRNIGSMLRVVFEQELQDCDIFDGVLGRGLMLGIRLKSDESIGPKVGQMCLQNGVYIGYYGHINNVLRIHPHLNIDEATARKGASAIINAIKTFASDPSIVSSKTFASFFTE